MAQQLVLRSAANCTDMTTATAISNLIPRHLATATLHRSRTFLATMPHLTSRNLVVCHRLS